MLMSANYHFGQEQYILLGKASKHQHGEVGIKCSILNIDIVYTIGEHTVFTDSKISNGIDHVHFKTKNLLIEKLKNTIQKKQQY